MPAREIVKTRIALLLEDDLVWSFPAWRRALPALATRHEVAFICLLPESFGKRRGLQVPFWYLKTFGFFTTMKLALFAIKIRLGLWRDGANWKSLAEKHSIPLLEAASVNAPELAARIRDEKIDAVWVMSGEILREEILKAPKLGCLNKHAGLLPSCKGVLPYFWARLHDCVQGVTVHVMDEKVDNGPMLWQEKIGEPHTRTMVSFYRKVFSLLPAMAGESIDRFAAGTFLQPDPTLTASLHSFPKRSDYLEFRRRGGEIISFRDILDANAEEHLS